eukprot:NODE_121_length_18880_cov_0.205687.p2 type:complete len:505 gc:universal NODE_121_length_18880_cov_0.205687:3611-5125(+)
MFQVQFGKPRKDYGKLPELTTQFHEIITKNDEVERKSPKMVNVVSDATRKYSIHHVNTTKVEYSNKQVFHKEGGWPREIDYLDNEQTSRFKKKIEKDDSFIKAVVEMGKQVEKNIMLNNALNIYENEKVDAPPCTDYKMQQVLTFRDAKCRPVQSVQYSCDYKQFIVSYQDDIHTNAFIWNLNNAVHPALSLLCNSQGNCFQFNPKDQYQIIGAMSSGQLCLWDVRKGSNAAFTSSVDCSHKDECLGVCWLQSKTGNEAASVGLDGTILFWDTRKLDEPTERVAIECFKDGILHGSACIEFDVSVATKFLVGTETGNILNCNRKGKTSVEKMGFCFPASSGAIKSVQRSPFCPKNFFSVSAQSIKLWSEDFKVPIWKYDGSYSVGCVSQSRPCVLFTGTNCGTVVPFDLAYSLTKPRNEFKISNHPITALKSNDKGTQLLCGTIHGQVTTVLLSDGYYLPLKSEKSTLMAMADHDLKREKTIDSFAKESKLRKEIGDSLISSVY